MEKDFCFRCGTPLIFSEDTGKFHSSQCQKCGQGYSKEKGKSLIESRANSSFTLPLYSIIFEQKKVSNEIVNRNVSAILEYDKRYIKVLIQDIDEELNMPKQKLNNLLNLKGSEEITRDFLSRLSSEIKKRLRT